MHPWFCARNADPPLCSHFTIQKDVLMNVKYDGLVLPV